MDRFEPYSGFFSRPQRRDHLIKANSIEFRFEVDRGQCHQFVDAVSQILTGTMIDLQVFERRLVEYIYLIR